MASPLIRLRLSKSTGRANVAEFLEWKVKKGEKRPRVAGSADAARSEPEPKEKMAYLNETVKPDPGSGKRPGQVHYENLCMKAVNQSIGRAIRHREDYAAILLLDHRYSRPDIQSQLPGWIRDRVQVADKFGPVVATTRKFFKSKKR